jgi:uncharacterized repeat protein (TIGR01451 family)
VFIEPSLGEAGEDKTVGPATPGKPGNHVSPLPSAKGVKPPQSLLDPSVTRETESNNTFATANPLSGTSGRVMGNIFPAADVDFFSITAATGNRLYVATQTLFDASGSGDSTLQVLDTDGTTVLETDNNDGTFNSTSSTIAGFSFPGNGTYFIRVAHNTAAGTIRPYMLNYTLQTGAPTAETEPNETTATANALPGSGWVSGTITATSPTEQDFYSINLNAGDSVYLSLDMNPERDVNVWNGRLGFGLFGNTPANNILIANDANAGAAPADPNSEAFFYTILTPGTYFVYVDSTVAAGLGATATYNLSVKVFPHVDATGTCVTYTSTNVPQVIPTGPGSVSSTITVPGNPIIADLDVSIDLNHTFMQDLDVHLISPAGNDNGLFTDIGAAAVGGPQTQMTIRLDDEAALPPAATLSTPLWLQPELAYRLGWFDGENAGGVWTLQIRDDAAGDGGTLNAWSITICEPAAAAACSAGNHLTTVFSTDFESGAAGFTHSGTADEWQLGTPAFGPITTCNSGVNCFKTDLVNTYDINSNQDLVSPRINLTGLTAPVTVNWAQRYHIESASFDHASVDVENFGGGGATRLFEWLDATMNNTVGNPSATINESSGWSKVSARADAYAGLNTQLRFHLDSDNSINLTGLAIDDVSVTACAPNTADLSVTKTDGVTTATPGGFVTYTITVSNAGPFPAPVATAADTFPAACTAVSTTSVAAGGATGNTAGPFAGNINDAALNLPAGSSVTYTSTCTINPAATGSLANTATVSSATIDPVPANNSATDTDTLTPSADIAVTKTDGVATANPGGTVTYTIVVSNAGPSNSPGSGAADTFPAACSSVSTTSVAAGGATGNTAGPFAGNINDAALNLPSGSSVTYTSVCTLNVLAAGSLSNTATASAGAGVTDPNPANNSATDTDTINVLNADIAVTKTDGVTNATPGGSVTYTIVISNAGPSGAPTATLTDNFPAFCTAVSTTSVAAGGATGNTAGPFAGNINQVLNLPSGGSVTYTSQCTISGAASGSLVNTATGGAGPGITDPTPGNNSATDTDTVGTPPNVSGTKTAAGTYIVGNNVTYTIILTNSGTTTQANNPGNEFIDILPATLQLVSANASSGTAVATVGTNTVTWNGSIAGSGSVTITIVATILPAAGGTAVSNQGTINYDADNNGTNESTRQTDDPAVAGSSNPTVINVFSPIPASSPLMLLLLAAALAGLALVKFGRSS